MRKILTIAISLLLLSATPAVSQAPQPTAPPVTAAVVAESERAFQIVKNGWEDVKAAYEAYIEDPESYELVVEAVDRTLKQLDGVKLHTCFAQWYAVEYTRLYLIGQSTADAGPMPAPEWDPLIGGFLFMSNAMPLLITPPSVSCIEGSPESSP